MSDSFRVLVIDDSVHIRRVVAEAVRDMFPSALITETGDGQAGLEEGLAGAWDLIVLDLSLPILSGLNVLFQIKPHKPDLRVIVLSLHDEPDYVLQCLEYGAAGYVGKDTLAEDFAPALRSILDGDVYISPRIAAGLPRRSGP